jgi:hypothetical protein
MSDEQLWKQHLGKGIKIPDVATVKDFFYFHVALCKLKILTVPSADSLNSSAEQFFSGFKHVTQTEISKESRSEVYHVSILSIREQDQIKMIVLILTHFSVGAQCPDRGGCCYVLCVSLGPTRGPNEWTAETTRC